MINVLDLIKPRCPQCRAPIPITAKQCVQCQSCGAILEDDRLYNMKLYFAFIMITIATGLFSSLVFSVILFPVYVIILMRNMRFVQKQE